MSHEIIKGDIYYRIIQVDTDYGYVLESGVMTNFGGWAWNFVMANPSEGYLTQSAERLGWKKWEGE